MKRTALVLLAAASFTGIPCNTCSGIGMIGSTRSVRSISGGSAQVAQQTPHYSSMPVHAGTRTVVAKKRVRAKHTTQPYLPELSQQARKTVQPTTLEQHHKKTRQEHRAKIKMLNAEKKDKKTDMGIRHKAELRQLNRDHLQEMNALEEKYRRARADLKQQHAMSKQRLEDNYTQAAEQLRMSRDQILKEVSAMYK